MLPLGGAERRCGCGGGSLAVALADGWGLGSQALVRSRGALLSGGGGEPVLAMAAIFWLLLGFRLMGGGGSSSPASTAVLPASPLLVGECKREEWW